MKTFILALTVFAVPAMAQSKDLRNAYLFEADLQSADLQGADLYKCQLGRADLRKATELPFSTSDALDRGMVLVGQTSVAASSY